MLKGVSKVQYQLLIDKNLIFCLVKYSNNHSCYLYKGNIKTIT